MTRSSTEWHEVDPGPLEVGQVALSECDRRYLCVSRTPEGLGALDNRCPHQGGPLGEGTIENGYLICPWHGYEYDPITGAPPEGYGDNATPYPIEERPEGMFVELPVLVESETLMDQMVEVMVDWGVDTVFGMVGHSNLGLADAFRKAEAEGRLTYIGIRHEGAASFAASAYGKLTGRPAACFSIAGPGATNLMTGLWDAKVDRIPILALTGQVDTQVLGPGAFQELPLAQAFEPVAEWSQTVLGRSNAPELMALAVKHAVVQRDVAHLIFPDEVQSLPAREDQAAPEKRGRIADHTISPPEDELQRAVELLESADRPAIVVGNGGRPFRDEIVALAEQIGAPLLTTFKAKGTVSEDHPLAGGVLGRSGTPIASAMMGRSDALLVLGASFSNHTGISERKPTIQIDFDRMTLGKFHPVDVPIWGELGVTLSRLSAALAPVDRPDLLTELAERRQRWRAEKLRRASMADARGKMHPAAVFGALSDVMPNDAVIPVDVGNNTYAFGHYFECRGRQDVLMSGYLGSIGFALPAALGAWTAVGDRRRVVSVSGDGGLGQYLADFTTAVKYDMPIVHIVLNNDELAKISREQRGALQPVYQTNLVNPDFAEFARSCGGAGFRVEDPRELRATFEEALGVEGRPALVEVVASPTWV